MRSLGKIISLAALLGCHAVPVESTVVGRMAVSAPAPAPAPAVDASMAEVDSGSVDAGAARAPTELSMVDEAHGWAIFLDQNHTMLETTDSGGASWNVIRSFVAHGANDTRPISAAFVDRTHAVLAWQEALGDDDSDEGTHLRIERTDDRGETWKTTHLVSPQSVMTGLSLSFDSARKGYLQSHIMSGMSSPPGFGPAWSTSDGGATWHFEGITNSDVAYQDCSTCDSIFGAPLKLPKPLHCASRYHTDSSRNISADLTLRQLPQGDALGNGILLAQCPDPMQDAGAQGLTGLALFVRQRGHWIYSSTQPVDAYVVFLKPNLFWRQTSGQLDASTDAGKTWHPASFPHHLGDPSDTYQNDIRAQFVSASVGFVFVPGQWLARTDDGGASWRDL